MNGPTKPPRGSPMKLNTLLAWRFVLRTDLGMSQSQQSVLLVLVDFCDASGFCRPSLSLVAQRAKVSRRTAVTTVEVLEARGFLARERRRADGKQAANGYRLNLPLLAGDQHAMVALSQSTPAAPGDDAPEGKRRRSRAQLVAHQSAMVALSQSAMVAHEASQERSKPVKQTREASQGESARTPAEGTPAVAGEPGDEPTPPTPRPRQLTAVAATEQAPGAPPSTGEQARGGQQVVRTAEGSRERVPCNAQAIAILGELRRHPTLAELATADYAETISSNVVGLGKVTIADVLTGIRELAAENSLREFPMPREELRRAVRTWANHAQKMRERETAPRSGGPPLQPAPAGGSRWLAKAANAAQLGYANADTPDGVAGRASEAQPPAPAALAEPPPKPAPDPRLVPLKPSEQAEAARNAMAEVERLMRGGAK